MNLLLRLTAALALMLALPGVSMASERTIVFGLIASGNQQTLEESFRPLAQGMSAALGRPVECAVFEDYAGAIWAMGAGKVQLAWFGNKSAIEAVDRSGGEVGAMALTESGGDGYRAHLIVRADSNLNSFEDVLRRAGDLTFGSGDPNSTSGTLVPGYYLFATRNLDPKMIFKRVTQANHENNFLAVAQGRADVATGNSVDLERYKSRYPDFFKNTRIIWTSPLIPSDPIVWRKDLAPELKTAIRNFLTAYARPRAGKTASETAQERAVMARLKWSGFKASDDSQLIPVRQLELHKRRQLIEANMALDETSKAGKLREIDCALNSLGANGTNAAP